MPISFIYWLILFLWAFFACWNSWPVETSYSTGTIFRLGGMLFIQFALFVLIGIKVFGSPVKRDA